MTRVKRGEALKIKVCSSGDGACYGESMPADAADAHYADVLADYVKIDVQNARVPAYYALSVICISGGNAELGAW